MLLKKLVAEAIGAAALLTIVVGSGIMGERLASGNIAIALLANAVATGAGLVALILTFGPISGAHLNPVVTATMAVFERRPLVEVIAYIAAQILGAGLGVTIAHVMFELPLVQVSTHVRSGLSQIVSEGLATFGLVTVILNVAKNRHEAVPYAVGAYITAAYWFTSSTSFANPAVTLARSMTDTFSGIAATSIPGFVLGQTIGCVAAVLLFHWFQGFKIESIPVKTVLFACVHNAGRSQMAAAWFNHLADPAKARAISAGTQPGTGVHPEVLVAMNEVGIDLSDAKPQYLSDKLAQEAEMLITMGCGEACPHVPGIRRDDWPLEDPKGKDVGRVREIRDEVKDRIQGLLEQEGWATP